MILSDRDIRAALQRLEDPLIVDPGFDPQRLQPASLEMTLHPTLLHVDEMLWHTRADGHSFPVGTPLGHRDMGDGGWEMLPGEFLLASTVETVRIPTDLVAQVNGKSSWARKGLIVHTTAGFIDPGFKGQITLELKNLSNSRLKIMPFVPICQLVFFQMTSPSERPYGSPGLGSHYQGQVGPTRSAA